MKFDLLRLVLNRRASLFEVDANREQWIRLAFSEPFEFIHRTQTYHYVPIRTGSPMEEQRFLVGRVGRPVQVREHDSPEAQLEEVTRDAWKAALVVIDPTAHEDGQKVGFAANEIGRTLAIARSLIDHANARYDSPYRIEVNPIVEEGSFDSFLEFHENSITYIQFDLHAPNMFIDQNAVDEEMRAVRDKYNAQKVRVTLSNPDGMTLNDGVISHLGEYAVKGGGSITARASSDDHFKSEEEVESVNVPSIPDEDNETFLKRVLRSVFG